MSVALHHEEIAISDKPVCCMCAEPAYIPYVYWRGPNFVICAECCLQIRKRELMTDIIHCTAVREIQKLYGGVTLERSSWSELGKKIKAEKAAYGMET
jgi:hypothetical protein